ncbi:aldo/keto reductase [bacterium]|nr:MAG: aldo/keto reductase [bacterium]
MTAPTRRLASGAEIPTIGLGTFGSDKYTPAQVAAAVVEAVEIGYRHIDCAAVYGNEREVGAALARTGVPREELWITGKLWNNRHADPEAACEESLRDLGLEYLDLYLVHWPFPNYHAPGVGVDSRDPHARPYIHDAYMATWRGLERLHRRGLVKHIGTSNMTIPKLELLLRDAEIKPAANEMELHPHFQQPELFDYVVSNGILPIGYSPLGSPSRPERDRTPEDTVDTEDPVILQVAERRGLTPAEVCIKWAVTRGQVPIPFSVKRHQFEASLRAACGEGLTDEEMTAIAGIDKGCRLIKGQVFLWEGARDWRDLWDEDGTIPS